MNKLSEPNEKGYQFCKNKELTEYAHKEIYQYTNSKLPAIAITVLEVYKDNKLISYLLVDENTNTPVKEALGYEAAACAIDAFRLLM